MFGVVVETWANFSLPGDGLFWVNRFWGEDWKEARSNGSTKGGKEGGEGGERRECRDCERKTGFITDLDFRHILESRKRGWAWFHWSRVPTYLAKLIWAELVWKFSPISTLDRYSCGVGSGNLFEGWWEATFIWSHWACKRMPRCCCGMFVGQDTVVNDRFIHGGIIMGTIDHLVSLPRMLTNMLVLNRIPFSLYPPVI